MWTPSSSSSVYFDNYNATSHLQSFLREEHRLKVSGNRVLSRIFDLERRINMRMEKITSG
jgi:hypothetical protein